MTPNPRILSQKQALAYINRSPSFYARNKHKFDNAGFPSKVKFLDGYDVKDLDAWIESLKASGSNLLAEHDWRDAGKIKI